MANILPCLQPSEGFLPDKLLVHPPTGMLLVLGTHLQTPHQMRISFGSFDAETMQESSLQLVDPSTGKLSALCRCMPAWY